MATSVVSVCNLALSRLGQSRKIVSITEQSESADACNAVFEHCRDEVLTECPWPFAMRRVDLAIVSERPNDDWAFAFRIPADCLTPRRVLSGSSRMAQPLTWERGGDSAGGLVFTDYQDAALEYVARVEDPSQWSPKFVNALAWRICMDVAPVLHDSAGFADVAMRNYRDAITVARAQALNEGVPDPERYGPFIDSRNGDVAGTGDAWSALPVGTRIS